MHTRNPQYEHYTKPFCSVSNQWAFNLTPVGHLDARLHIANTFKLDSYLLPTHNTPPTDAFCKWMGVFQYYRRLSLLSNIQLISSDVLFAVLSKWSKHFNHISLQQISYSPWWICNLYKHPPIMMNGIGFIRSLWNIFS